MKNLNSEKKMGPTRIKVQQTGMQAGSQKGAILIVSLVILLIVTLIATTNMETSILEERMAGNIQEYNLAFQAAEASLTVAEAWLTNQIFLPTTSTDGSTAVWATNAPSQVADTGQWWQERPASWWASNADTISGLSGVDSQPQYLIEQFFTSVQGQDLSLGTGAASPQRILHRITSKGVGGNENAVVMMQATYIRPYD